MTEFEINKKVAEILGLHIGDFYKLVSPDDYNDSEIYVSVNKNDYYEYSYDPCNNVEQAWEIMMKYNICVTKEPRGNYVAFEGLVITGVDDADWIYDTWHSKPLVAAMLCFLELQTKTRD